MSSNADGCTVQKLVLALPLLSGGRVHRPVPSGPLTRRWLCRRASQTRGVFAVATADGSRKASDEAVGVRRQWVVDVHFGRR